MAYSSQEHINRYGRRHGAGATTMPGMPRAMTVNVDVSALDSMIDGFAEAVEEAVRPAAQAGAEVVYNAVLSNVATRVGVKSGRLENAIYQVFSRDNSSESKSTYHVSWNYRKAPHAHLVEFGYIKRYVSYVGKDGRWHTAVRPSARGKPKPRSNASQAEKDAYYVTLPGGPVQVPGKAFMRSAATSFDRAYQAAEAEFLRQLAEKTGGRA